MAKASRPRQRPTAKPGKGVRYRHETVDSLHEYLRVVNEINDSWDDPDSFSPDPWYRGVRDASKHKLIPGFYRLPEEFDYLEEDDYREEFMRRAPPLLDGRIPTDNWEWYFLMQHYGLPTRLLDWTEGSLTALFFAVEDFQGLGKPSADAAVWMLDPWYLNEWSIKTNEILVYTDDDASPYLSENPFDEVDPDDDKDWQRPVAVMPTYKNNRRLAAQRGMFTIHGTLRKPLETMLPVAQDGKPRLVKIVISKKSIPTIQEHLRRTGLTDVVLFPELPSLALDMRRSWERPWNSKRPGQSAAKILRKRHASCLCEGGKNEADLPRNEHPRRHRSSPRAGRLSQGEAQGEGSAPPRAPR